MPEADGNNVYVRELETVLMAAGNEYEDDNECESEKLGINLYSSSIMIYMDDAFWLPRIRSGHLF